MLTNTILLISIFYVLVEYTKKEFFANSFFVIPAGFEPTTHSLEGCCSIQLSYETIKSGAKLRNFSDISIYLA